MIIKNKYDYEKMEPSQYGFYTLRDYQRTIITKINQSKYKFMIESKTDPVIFVGINGYICLSGWEGFMVLSIYSTDNPAPVGILAGTDVYIDERLHEDEVWTGQLNDILSELRVKDRKKKLEQLNWLKPLAPQETSSASH